LSGQWRSGFKLLRDSISDGQINLMVFAPSAGNSIRARHFPSPSLPASANRMCGGSPQLCFDDSFITQDWTIGFDSNDNPIDPHDLILPSDQLHHSMRSSDWTHSSMGFFQVPSVDRMHTLASIQSYATHTPADWTLSIRWDTS
jgi:hypothetical protein